MMRGCCRREKLQQPRFLCNNFFIYRDLLISHISRRHKYACDSKICKGCPRRSECFGASMSGKMVTRHVWQDALDSVTAFTKTAKGRRIYAWRKETIEQSFAETKQNHGLRYARMLGIQNMREQCFLTAAIQNIKRMVDAWLFICPCRRGLLQNPKPATAPFLSVRSVESKRNSREKRCRKHTCRHLKVSAAE